MSWTLWQWTTFGRYDPAPEEVVFVISEEWEHPKVLRYHPIGRDGRHRLYELDGSRFYYYPERMRWMPVPPIPQFSRTNPATTEGG